MLSPQAAHERRYSRVQLPVSAKISCEALDRFEEPAYLRDISAGGAFFYIDLAIPAGAFVRVDFAVPVVGTDVIVRSEGTVVRVEEKALGEKKGVAVQFASLYLSS